MRKRIILFTEVFPYYGRETFLELEIQYLSRKFEEVIIVPFRANSKQMRQMPSNCRVTKAVTSNRWEMYLQLFIPTKAYMLFFRDFIEQKVVRNKKRFKTWLIALAMTNSYLLSSEVRKLIRHASETDVFYSYWGKGGCFLAPLRNKEAAFISRFHGEWDLWEERCGNYGPIRQSVLSNLDMAFPISIKGDSYLKDRYVINRSAISRLGTCYHGITKRSKDGVFRIVSCSTVNANKRVLYMLEIFAKTDIPLEWTHIGIGPDYEELKKRALTIKNERLKVNILGRLPNEEIFTYYLTHSVDAFLNLSRSEGIPVSIMEAISCNIPAIATDVGSTSEIVNSHSGVLLGKNPTADDVYLAIELLKHKNIQPFDFWNQNYNADNNYNSFMEKIAQL